jgi:UDP-N-acetyl-D-glucosamine dehydrogenase
MKCEQHTVAIVGLGYVGLPLARAATDAGYEVVGLDRSPSVVENLNAGHSHIDDLSDADVQEMVRHGFTATLDETVIVRADVVVICVPTPLAVDGSPDLSSVRSAAESTARNLKDGALVVLESTTYPGTTEDLLVPILEDHGKVGRDFYVAFSPERVDPGNAVYGIRNTPKVVGGVTAACTEMAVGFYDRIVDTVVPARGAKEAETAKLLENTYRHINIALVNELARVCHEMEIDVWDVIRCASTKPFGFQAFYPGPGVGGHCIPIDPNYLSYAVRQKLGHPLRFVELAQEINQGMPAYVYRRAQDSLNVIGKALRGARVLLVGVTYKPDIADQRESPADALVELLGRAGCDVRYYDPHVGKWCPNGHEVQAVASLPEPGFDLVVVLQHHSGLVADDVLASGSVVFDTRGSLAGKNVVHL